MLGSGLGHRIRQGPVAACKFREQASSTSWRQSRQHGGGQQTLVPRHLIPSASLQHPGGSSVRQPRKQPHGSQTGLPAPASSRSTTACRALPLAYLPSSGHPNWDLICALGAAAAAYTWVKVFDKLATSGIIDQVYFLLVCHFTFKPNWQRQLCVHTVSAEAEPKAGAHDSWATVCVGMANL